MNYFKIIILLFFTSSTLTIVTPLSKDKIVSTSDDDDLTSLLTNLLRYLISTTITISSHLPSSPPLQTTSLQKIIILSTCHLSINLSLNHQLVTFIDQLVTWSPLLQSTPTPNSPWSIINNEMNYYNTSIGHPIILWVNHSSYIVPDQPSFINSINNYQINHINYSDHIRSINQFINNLSTHIRSTQINNLSINHITSSSSSPHLLTHPSEWDDHNPSPHLVGW